MNVSSHASHLDGKNFVLGPELQSIVDATSAASWKVVFCKVECRSHGAWGLQGYGTLLMQEAERIARIEHHSSKLAVISGVGTRHYYRKLGYHLEGHYMVKHLKPSRSRHRTLPAVL